MCALQKHFEIDRAVYECNNVNNASQILSETLNVNLNHLKYLSTYESLELKIVRT